MWDKIKSALGVFFRGAFQSLSGFAGAAMVLLSLYFCFDLLTGTASLQNFIKNRRDLGRADTAIEIRQKQLDKVNMHIRLIQEHSPDFISEMALRHLNLGDPKVLIIKK